MEKILIIDDESQVRTLLKKMLQREGYDVVTASDGHEGVNMFKKDPVDLVLTDIIMPEKEGIEVIQELRQSYPDLPIITMSGGGRNSPESYLSVAKLLGANAVFEKPVEREKLLSAIKKALKK